MPVVEKHWGHGRDLHHQPPCQVAVRYAEKLEEMGDKISDKRHQMIQATVRCVVREDDGPVDQNKVDDYARVLEMAVEALGWLVTTEPIGETW